MAVEDTVTVSGSWGRSQTCARRAPPPLFHERSTKSPLQSPVAAHHCAHLLWRKLRCRAGTRAESSYNSFTCPHADDALRRGKPPRTGLPMPTNAPAMRNAGHLHGNRLEGSGGAGAPERAIVSADPATSLL